MTSIGAPPAGPDRSTDLDRLLPVADGSAVRRYLRAAFAHRWRWIVITAATIVAESALGLAAPIAIGWITQDIADHQPASAIVGPVLLLAAAAIAAAIIGWASGVMLARTVLPELAALRADVVSTALDLPLDEVEAGGIGDLVSRVCGDVDSVTEATENSLGAFLWGALAIVSALVGLAALDWRFALAGLLAVPIQVHTLRWYLRTSRPIYAAGRIAEGHRTAALLGAFAVLPTVRAFRLAHRQRHLVESSSLEAAEYEIRATHAATRFYGRLNLAEFIGLGAILAVGYILVQHDQVSLGAATTAALFFAGLFDPINTLLATFDDIQRAGAGLGRLVGIIERPPAKGRRQDIPPQPVLCAEAVDFGYGDGPDVLHQIDVNIGPGQHVAVVGASGSGKSTLATLLVGIRHPRRGRITLAGTDLRQLDPVAMHRTVALITQETHVFTGSIADNLRLANPSADDAAIRATLEDVGAANWVDLLPAGTDTQVGAGGHWLPPNQAQHLALARILLLAPAILLLDEATAEAGSDTSRQLDVAAATVLRGRAGLVIAHRLSQAANADTILVVDDGRIVERGSHDELLSGDGRYAALWRAWSTPQ